MTRNRYGAALGILAAGTLALSGCGSDPNSSSPGAASPGGSSADSDCGGTETLKASGSTAQQNAMARFVKTFIAECPDQTVNYTANGSGAGIREFVGGQTDFAGTDVPLSADEYAQAQQRCESPAWNLPAVFGPIAITYNIAGVDNLILDGPTVAKIFNGAVTSWDDPAVKDLNPGAALPAAPIHVVFRSDESGTTDNFQKYLEGASDGAWGKGTGKSFNGGVGEGAKGNDGTAAAISTTEGAITYNEWSFAQAKNLPTAQIITSAGPEPVAISAESVGKTIAGATIKGEGNDLVLDTASFYKPSNAGSYPIVLATYEVVCSKYPDAEVGTAVRMFLKSTITSGQFGLDEYGYVPIPDAFKPRLTTAVDAIE
ncbi:phosphate ABC transporter substrate-binding protein PstS [Mycolicibacter senuensis]|uniref:Phosphate-binding protein n=1 Tax=Mycolicibacter senuensis TaxID=386913 RepID=A0A7I9XQY3_9MYCO|nr:phosphate ABC transporter substrate-binding protein PstS [Mycolicibacter senuensis]MDQ2629124.1 phosphate ABC transporter substrate-binding protein PstS [Actinomycetota bacterium]ORW67188.1 phosphate-binding protein [Mycolicibacter senuensis]GFG72393.1 phosphate-binding protein PstS [Mycolicibacter senuensis]